MTSPNDPQSPKEDMSWLHEEPTSIGERPPGLPPTPPTPAAPPAPPRAAMPQAPKPAATKPDAPANKVRGVFGKPSLPPPPAGRGPISAPRPLDAKPELPAPPTLGAPELPGGVNAADDPIADLFADGAATPEAQTIVMEADAPVEREDPTLVPSGNDGLFADVERSAEPAPVAKLGLAKTMLASTAAEEIMAHEPTRDPRSEDSLRPSDRRPSNLDGVVFDPDQSVARHLGEVAIDGQVGPAAVSDALADLPLPQVPTVVSPSEAPIDAVPVRSMRSAMMIMALVLISGGAATLMSLGVLGGSPAEYRKQAAASKPTKPVAAPTPTPANAVTASAPSVATAPRIATPTVVAPEPVAPTEPAPTAAEAAPVPAPVADDPTPAAPEPSEATPTAATPTTGASGNPIEDGDALLRAGEADAALAQYQAALAADPRDHHAMEGLVKIHLARGQHQAALGYAEQIVKRRPKRAAYRILHGQALLGVGDRAGARQAFQDALGLEPDNREAQRLLGP